MSSVDDYRAERLTSFTRANCLIALPEQLTDADRGDEVDILLLDGV
ncbi:hypothetical protein [Streptomyces sp. 2A115]